MSSAPATRQGAKHGHAAKVGGTLNDAAAVAAYFRELQDRICEALVDIDGTAFDARELTNARGGVARPRVLTDGKVIEKAAVNFSHSRGDSLPLAATERRPELAGRSFEATSVSLIVHPRNPYAPTSHANIRFFIAHPPEPASDVEEEGWWFGGGFDLTPYYGFEEDAVHWHRTAAEACGPFGDDLYGRYKAACDDYFYIPHRQAMRGVWTASSVASPSPAASAITSCPPTCRSWSAARTCDTASASVVSSSTAAGATWSSTWCTTAARVTDCRREPAPSPSSRRCRRSRPGGTTTNPNQGPRKRASSRSSWSAATGSDPQSEDDRHIPLRT